MSRQIVDYKISDIAEYTLFSLFSKGISVCPLKLQKILYYIQSWYMVYFDEKLIFDELPESWVNGPVYRSIYYKYNYIGMYEQIKPDDVSQEIINAEDESKFIKDSLDKLSRKLFLSEDHIKFLEFIYNHYGTMSHDKLVFLTHSEKPWSEARENLSPFQYSDKYLSVKTMYSYYKNRLDKNRAKYNNE